MSVFRLLMLAGLLAVGANSFAYKPIMINASNNDMSVVYKYCKHKSTISIGSTTCGEERVAIIKSASNEGNEFAIPEVPKDFMDYSKDEYGNLLIKTYSADIIKVTQRDAQGNIVASGGYSYGIYPAGTCGLVAADNLPSTSDNISILKLEKAGKFILCEKYNLREASA